jgi:eukaryotic-like serine/threonine-protein kinase
MSLTVGTRFGPYEIIALIGAGGMGEVYRARDARLGRDVALKTLPPAFTDNAERLRRFEIEARAASLLSHPNILTIHDIGTANGQPYIVSELLEGENLRERLTRGHIPLDKTIGIAAAVADALAAAHARGIVHRDLKPENLLLTRDGRVKILDFGIAKLTAPDPDQPGGAETVAIVTDAGVAVGTLGYMAPEQLRGDPVDPRSDLFALGAIIHEMVSGAPAFKRDSRIATVNAVLEADPPALDESVPSGIRRIVRRCLEKDPDHRFQSARDLAFALGALSDTAAPVARTVRPPRWPRIDSRLAILGILLAAAAAGAIGWYSDREPAPSRPIRRYSFQPSAPVIGFDLSPDGTALAYTAGLSSANRLFVRPLDELDATLLPGTEGAQISFFSPDGEWIAFGAGGKLKKIRKSGGPAITLCDVGMLLDGAWGPNGQIVIAQREQGLMTVSAEGGPLVPLTTSDTDAGEIDHHAPRFLPGGEAILFTIHAGPELFRIAVRSLVTGEQRTLIDDGYDARYAASGHLVYGRDGGLYATRFDADQLRPDGVAVLAVERVRTLATNGFAMFSIASDGTLVYVPAPPIEGRTLVWVDRSGREEPLPLPPRGYAYPALSPDGKRLAVQISEGPTTNVWLHDLASGALQPLTRGESDTRPVWSANGNALTYASRQPDGRHIVLQPLEASAVPRSLVVSHNDVWPGAWTPDNRLLFVEDPPTSISSILQWRDGIPSQPELLLTSPPMAPHTPTVSPDGQWLMYTIFQRGLGQVVVRPMAGGTPRQITADGGTQPRWTRDGTEIVFRHRGRFMSVPIRRAASFEAGRPQELFADTYISDYGGPPGYDVTADGTRFLVVKPAEGERSVPPLHFVDNWFSELRRRVPSGR